MYVLRALEGTKIAQPMIPEITHPSTYYFTQHIKGLNNCPEQITNFNRMLSLLVIHQTGSMGRTVTSGLQKGILSKEGRLLLHTIQSRVPSGMIKVCPSELIRVVFGPYHDPLCLLG